MEGGPLPQSPQGLPGPHGRPRLPLGRQPGGPVPGGPIPGAPMPGGRVPGLPVPGGPVPGAHPRGPAPGGNPGGGRCRVPVGRPADSRPAAMRGPHRRLAHAGRAAVAGEPAPAAQPRPYPLDPPPTPAQPTAAPAPPEFRRPHRCRPGPPDPRMALAERIAKQKQWRQSTNQGVQFVALQVMARQCNDEDMLAGNDDPNLPLVTCIGTQRGVSPRRRSSAATRSRTPPRDRPTQRQYVVDLQFKGGRRTPGRTSPRPTSAPRPRLPWTRRS